MYELEETINPYYIINKNIPSKILSWITILIITLIIFIIMSIYVKFDIYENYTGFVTSDNEKYFIKLLVSEKSSFEMPIKELIINNKEIKYKVHSVGTDYYIDEQSNKNYELLIKANIEDNYKINNLPILLQFKGEKTTLIKEFIKNIKKGMM